MLVKKQQHTYRELDHASCIQGLSWGSGAAFLIMMLLFTETLWLICFEVVTLGLSLFLQNWEIILSPGFWIEWRHRQVARIITWGVGENWGGGLGEEVVGDSTGLWVMLLLASRVLQRVWVVWKSTVMTGSLRLLRDWFSQSHQPIS